MRTNLSSGRYTLHLAGCSFYQQNLKAIKRIYLSPGNCIVPVWLRHDAENAYDVNAIEVLAIPGDLLIGHMKAEHAKTYAKMLDALAVHGMEIECTAKLFGGRGGKVTIGGAIDMDARELREMWKAV